MGDERNGLHELIPLGSSLSHWGLAYPLGFNLPNGSTILRITTDHSAEEFDGLFEIALFEDPLAGIGLIRFGIEELV